MAHNSLVVSNKSMDRSRSSPEKLSTTQLENFLDDIKNQPHWRSAANEEAAYFDNHQWSVNEIQELIDRDQPILTTNLIAPTINLLTGAEIKNRTDWVVRSERQIKEDIDTAEALTVEIKEAERLSGADVACSDAYASEIKVGLGWLEVTRNPDPFKYPYQVNYIHRREIYWDWRAKDPLLDDARFLLRKRWLDEDAAKLIFPRHRDLIKHSVRDWAGWDDMMQSADENLINEYGVKIESNIDETDWLDTSRRRVCINELWYRIWKRGLILRTKNNEVYEFDKRNPGHRAAIVQGAGSVEEAIFPKTRLSFWMGPHRVEDMPTPLKHSRFPYTPFFGYREDKNNTPFGLIRYMKSPQDEVNARKAKLMFLLAAKRVIADADAVDNHDDVREEVARPDAYIKTNPDRVNKDGFKVETELGLSAQQMDVMVDAKQSIQDVVGVYKAMLGQSGAADSGVAINSLIEQGFTNMSKLNSNFMAARTRTGELLLSLIMADLEGREKHVKVVKAGLGKPKNIYLNRSFIDETSGTLMISNDTTKIRTKLVLDDVPQTPTYRAQQFKYLMEISKSLPEDVQRLMAPSLIEYSDMPGRADIAKNVKQMMGVPQDPDEMTDEEKKQAEDDQAKQAEAAALEKANAEAEVKKIEADARKTDSEAVKLSAEAAALLADRPEIAPATDDILERTEEPVT